MNLFIEQGIRGGISTAVTRYTKGQNGINEKKSSSDRSIFYIDANK
jgi:hypothetical protein